MIAAWMLYCTTIAVLLACAALPAERFVQHLGGATRRVWCAALGGVLLLPVAALFMKDAPAAVELSNVVVPTSASSGLVMEGVQTLAALDTLLGVSWIVASVVVFALIGFGLGVTWWRRRRWTPAEVDGVPVLISEDVGPAVVGLLRSQIVLPSWALHLRADERSMMLRHEQEHVETGDPRLVLFGAMVAAILPWNVVVWFMLRRLRLAVEVDCDRRVVQGGGLDLRGYAELLLTVGARRAVPAYGVGFSVGRPFLEQRIDRMTLPRPARSRAHAAFMLLGVAGVLGAAWSLPQPVRAAKISQSINWCADDPVDVSRQLLSAYDWST